MQVSALAPRERIGLDRSPIEEMCRSHGIERAETLVGTAMEELAVWLPRLERLRKSGNRGELARLARLVSAVGQRIGMAQMASVCSAVAEMAPDADEATLAAVTGRAVRLGEASLNAVWELQGLSV